MAESYAGCIGIDLGTTNSCVGVWRDNRVEIIPNSLGDRTTPSWVAFTEASGRLVGQLARRQAGQNPTNTVYDVKRLMGRFVSELEEEIAHLSYAVHSDNNGRPLIRVQSGAGGIARDFKPEEISAFILADLKATAEAYLGQPVKKAVITVPAYFNDGQRQATKDAATIAGLDCIRIINEPTAGCLCYGLDRKPDNLHVLVFDLGGGTFDVSVLLLQEGVFQVLATAGDTHLGGEDIDRLLLDDLVARFRRQSGVDLRGAQLDARQRARSLKRLQFAAEQAKIQLSNTEVTTICVEALDGAHDFNCTMTRTQCEEIMAPVLKACFPPVKQVLKDAGLAPEQIDEIVLVGGSTRIPALQRMLSSHFLGKRLNKSVNPDEAVAYGATVQGAILTDRSADSQVKDLVLLDVTPLSMGIETSGGLMTRVIERNSNIPCEQSKMFSTCNDNQSSVLIQVYEGERRFTRDNHLLGTFELGPIPEAPRGVPKIKVTFTIDSNGILCVTAVDKNTGLSTEARLTQESGRLTGEEINRMIADGERYKMEDEMRLAAIQERAQFEHYLMTVQRAANDPHLNGALEEAEVSFINQYLINTFQWLAENPAAERDVLQQARLSVEHNLKALLYRLYRQGTATTGEAGAGGAGVSGSVDEAINDAVAALVSEM